MATKFQILRSTTAGNRPTGKQYGEPYVNFADNQFGVVDSSNTAHDLLGVPIFSPSISYALGSPVNHLGLLYIANTAVAAGTWNPAQWIQVTGGGGTSGITISDTLPASPTNGQLWWESDTGILWLYYIDPNTSQWIAISSPGVIQASGLVLLNTLVANNSTNLTDTTSFTSAYDSYEFEFVNCVPNTAGVALQMQVQIGGSWITTGYQSFATGGYTPGTTLGTDVLTGSFILSGGSNLNFALAGGGGCTGIIRLHGINSSVASKFATGNGAYISVGGSALSVITLGGYVSNTGVITGVRFFFGAGNIVTGTIRIYGRKTS
jgi:hypothetical protein